MKTKILILTILMAFTVIAYSTDPIIKRRAADISPATVATLQEKLDVLQRKDTVNPITNNLVDSKAQSVVRARHGADSIWFNATNHKLYAKSGRSTFSYAPFDSTATASTLLTGILGYWNLDQNSATLDDAVGTFDLTNSGGVVNQAGKIGQSVQFDTNTDYVRNSTISQVVESHFSVSFWVNMNAMPASRVMTFAGLNTAPGSRFSVNMASGASRIQVDQSNGTTIYNGFSNSSVWTSGTWHHVVVLSAVDGGKHKIYIDGVSNFDNASSGTFTGTFAAGALVEHILIGGHDGSSKGVDGYVDEVGYWTRWITEDEIAELYKAGTGRTHPFLP